MPGGVGGFAQKIFFGRDSDDHPSAAAVHASGFIPRSFVQAPGFTLQSIDPESAMKFHPELPAGTGGVVRITPTGSAAQTAFGQRFPRSLADLDRLREEVRPGFSLIRAARLQAVEDARRKAVGNLRENLSKRRVLGSSFAQDALARAEREFAQAAAQESAETFVQEAAMTQSVLDQERGVISEALNRELELLEFTTQTSLNLQGLALDQSRIKASAIGQDERINLEYMKLTRDVINDIAKSASSGMAAAG